MKTFTRRVLHILSLLAGLLFFNNVAKGQIIFANSQRSGASGLLCVNCNVTNAAQAADGDLQSHSNINVAVGLLAQTWQETIFPAPVTANTPVSVKIGSGDNLLSLQALGAISLQAYNGNSAVGSAVTANQLATVLNNNNQYLLKFTPTAAYDRVRVTVNGGLVGALATVYLYDAYYSGPITACNQAVDELNGISSALLGLGLGVGGVQNPQQAIDGNINTASTLNAGVGVAGAFAQQTAIFQRLSQAGDSVRLTVAIPQALLDANVLTSISVTTFNGNTSNNDATFFNSGLLNLRLLDLAGTRRRAIISFAPTAQFDRVQLRLGGGIANVLSSLDLYEIQRVIPSPTIIYNGNPANSVNACAGSTVNLSVTNIPNTTFAWYTAQTGGTAVATGTSFTTPALNATTTYYVEAVRAGCSDPSQRAAVTINVFQIPAAPVVANATATICTGQTATFTATAVTGVTVNWYADATGGAPIATGNSFTTQALTANTTYYAEGVSGGLCVSPSRTAVNVVISPTPATPTLTATNVNICSGNPATLTVDNPVAGVTYNWYSTATGGTVLNSGTSFTTPALTANATYYVEAANASGCTSTARAQGTVTVQPIPANPTVSASNATINAGQTTTLTVTNVQTGNTYNWYTSSTATASVFTGTSFTTPQLYSNTTYYVGAVNSAGCPSAARTAVNITVNINTNAPCSFANQQSTDLNGACVLCNVSNGALAVDADTTTASRLTLGVGLLNAYVGQELRFQTPGLAGDTIKLGLQSPVGLADLSVLNNVSVIVMNGATVVNTYSLNSALLSLSLLVGNRFYALVPATGAYDRIVIRLNSGVASAVTSLDILYAIQRFPKPVFNPLAPEICRGGTATIAVTSPTGGTINWFTTPTGGTSIATGASFITGPLNANTTYYAEYTRGTCTDATRYPVLVLVNDVPAAPTVSASNVTVNSGQPATLNATASNGATINWYTTATGGTPVATGNSFTTAPLTANATYYAEAAAGTCVSTTRTPVTVTVNPIVIPNVTVTPASVTLAAGQITTFTASSTTPGAQFRWYTTPTGGTSIYTGATYNTPAQFANTIYYAEAFIPATGAVSATRAPGAVVIDALAPSPVACDAAIDQTTDVNGVVCLGCGVSNATGAVDNDRNTFSRLNVTVGLLNAYVGQTLRFNNVGSAGDSVIVELGVPGSLADVSVLSGISLATYNGTTFNNDRFTINGSLLNVSLLNGTTRFRVAFRAGANFDRVEIRLASTVGALSALNVYTASQSVAAPVIAVPALTVCQGGQATITATVPAGVTVKWYSSANGGSPIFTGATFTTPALSATATYYAEGSRTATDCAQAVRTPATVTVTPPPAAPVVAVPNVTICSGSTATFAATAVPGVTISWYATPTGGTALAAGNNFTSPALTATTTYYAEAAAGSCASTTRTAVTATVSGAVADATVAQTTVQSCSGATATLSATSAQPGVVFNWYTVATGGTPVFTGANFTTPALTANTSYYVQAADGTCTSPNRVKVDVVVNPTPAAPVVTTNPTGGQITAGQTASISATSTTPGVVFNWYTAATGGTPIFTGTPFVTPALSSTTTYYVESQVPGSGCTSPTRTAVTITVNPVFSTACDVASSQLVDVNGGVACIGCTVANPNNSVDTDPATFSRITLPIAIAGSQVSQTLIFSNPGAVGDTVSIQIGVPANITSAAVLSQLQVASFNGATYNGDRTAISNSAIRVSILAGGQTAIVKFAPQAAFDRIEVRLNSGVASLFNTADVYFASMQVEAPRLAAGTVNICAGASATLTVANARAGVNYQWFTAATGGTPVFTGTTYTINNVTANVTYYVQSVRASNNCPNPNRVAANINVTPTPVPPTLAANNVSICAGDPATLTVTNAGTATVNWYNAATGGALVATGATLNVNPATTTIYYAELTNGACISPSRTAGTVTVNPRPAAPSLIAANVQVCTGGSATLQVNTPETGVNYAWYTTATGGTAVFTGATFVTGPLTANTTYYVMATNAGTGCTNNGARTMASVTVSGTVANPTLSATATTVCAGGSASISVTNPVAGFLYNWYTAATGGSAVFTGITYNLNNLTANATFYVEASNGNGCTSAGRTQTTITVQPAPVAPVVQVAGGGNNVCAGASASLSISNPQPTQVYRWYTAATGGTLLFTGVQFNTPPLTAATTYYVEASTAGNCNPSTRTAVALNVTALPADPTLTNANVTVCPGTGATLTVASPQAGITYRWYATPARTTVLFEGTTFVTPAVNGSATYYLVAANASGCQSNNTAVAQVTTTTAPAAPLVVNSNVTTCPNTQATLSIASPMADHTYRWYTAATGGTAIFTGTTFTTPNITATVTYYAEAVNATGCASTARTSVTVSPSAAPNAPAATAAAGNICPNTSTTLSVTSPDASLTYSWYASATGGTALATGTTFTTPNLTATTIYYVGAANSSSCSSATRTAVTVTVLPVLAAPTVTVGITTTNSVTFAWVGVPGAISYQISLDNGATYINPSSGIAGLTHTVAGLQPAASVTIIVRAIGTLGCQQSAPSAAVTGTATNPLGNGIFIPNAFTPNGDGNNDVFMVFGTVIKSMTLRVYDQWGELQFRSDSQTNGWNGTYKGRLQPVGVYVYYLDATMNDGSQVQKKGTINLLR